MLHRNVRIARFAILFGVVTTTPAFAQQFTHNTTSVPANAGNYTENVDFADIDNDGDWDAVFANGGDAAQLQNAVWVNQGFLQGGTLGSFLDATAARAPAILDQSRDIEFVDFDADGDVDIYVSNTAQIVNQGNRWWANMGGLQGGTSGFYQEQTSTRWVNLGGAGSSIAPSQIISGTFIDFSCDCDFGDLDNDGDVDLVHSSYGFSLQGNVPTRLFFNDGAGHFSEFNPSGFQLAGRDIANGNPGIWCQGTQSANTTNTTGVNCDVAASPLDVDVGDIDGDLDIDILLGSRNELPRMFVNRLADNGGVMTFFRDVTGSAFPANYSTGQGHYEQEMGDFDNDGDLDIYGLNWLVAGASFNDATYQNNGSGVFAAPVTMAGSSSDDNETDFFDYNLDGNLDVFLTNFSGQERIYTGNGAGTMTLASGLLPVDGTTSLDSDCCDVDNDGDYDVFVANDLTGASSNEWYLQNGTTSNDVTPPTLRRLEQAPNRVAGVAPTVVRVQVYDNAPYYITWYNTTVLEVQVNGGATVQYPMKPSMGQIFRGEIPGNLVGTITYRAVSTDKYGNTGVTSVLNYTATGASLGTAFCFGDGTQTTPCPCANNGAAGRGCANSTNAAGALLTASGTTTPDTGVLSGSGMPATVSAIYLKGDSNNGTGLVFGDGVRCTDGALIRLRTKNNVGGASQFPDSTDTVNLSTRGATPSGSGLTAYYQVYYRNAASGFCPPETFNVSNGIIVTW